MGMVNRRKRQRLGGPETLAAAWDRGEAPPEWAFEPGGHTEELSEIAFFGTDTGGWMFAQDHPHYRDWWAAFQASKR